MRLTSEPCLLLSALVYLGEVPRSNRDQTSVSTPRGPTLCPSSVVSVSEPLHSTGSCFVSRRLDSRGPFLYLLGPTPVSYDLMDSSSGIHSPTRVTTESKRIVTRDSITHSGFPNTVFLSFVNVVSMTDPVQVGRDRRKRLSRLVTFFPSDGYGRHERVRPPSVPTSRPRPLPVRPGTPSPLRPRLSRLIFDGGTFPVTREPGYTEVTPM